jgi:hypothetical protein
MRRIIAISLLLIFGAGQINLTWASHFCGVFKVKSELMLGHGHLDCGMPEMNDCDIPNQQPGTVIIEENGCCENIYFASDSDDTFNAAGVVKIQRCDFLIITLFAFINLSGENSNTEFHTIPSPHLIHTDKCVLYQTFII